MREFYLQEELIDIRWIFIRAFNELNDMNSKNEHYFSALRLLSEGFERLFKIAIAISYWEDVEKVKEKTSRIHDLENLLDRAIGGYENKGNLNKIKNEQIVKRILAVLSYFAKYGRYYNLDIICGNIPDEDSPKSTWQGIESDLQSDFVENDEITNLTNKFSSVIEENIKITAKIEKLTEIIYRKSNLMILEKLKRLINEVCEIILISNKKQAFLNSDFVKEIKIIL